MCQNKANGGQRCVGHARTSLTNAVAKYDALAAQANEFTAARQVVPADLVVRGMKSQHKVEDARVMYASTHKGEADLRTQMETAPTYASAHGGPSRADLAEAVRDGLILRARNARIKAAVRAGTMTRAQARIEAEYPEPGAQQWRERCIASALERNAQMRERAARREETGFAAQDEPRVRIQPHPEPEDPHARLAGILGGGKVSAAALERANQMTARYEKYDTLVRESLQPGGTAALEARLAALPEVPRGGYHKVGVRPQNPSAEYLEAEVIAEVLDDAWLHRGHTAQEIPTESAQRIRAHSIIESIKYIENPDADNGKEILLDA